MSYQSADFWLPPLTDAADALRRGLEANFLQVDVSVGECPDLQTLGCAFSGLNGRPFLVEIGGEPYVHNPNYRADGEFDMDEIMRAEGRPGAKILGAGFPSLVATGGRCGELIPCLELAGKSVSKLARVSREDKSCEVEEYPSCLNGGLGNLYASDGLPGEVIQIEVKTRTGEQGSLSQIMRAALATLVEGQDGRELAMGGIFSVLEGQVRAHISPDFDCVPFEYYDFEKEMPFRQDFLQFYEGMGPDLMCTSIFWTGDPTGGAMHLRGSGEHTHFFSTVGKPEAGHYHHDVTPEAIHYKGYFQLAERVIRVGDIYAELAVRG
ncbi:MAG: DUF1907 domain-containing protein [Thiolinea sp.]